MKTFYIRFDINNNITHCYINRDFSDLYEVETTEDLFENLDKYTVTDVNEVEKTCNIIEL